MKVRSPLSSKASLDHRDLGIPHTLTVFSHLGALISSVIKVYMKRKSRITKKKNRQGLPPTGKGELLGVRIHPPQFVALDSWIAQNRTSPPGLRLFAGC